MNANRWKSHTPMLLFAAALSCALVWVARTYPIPWDQTNLNIERINDRFWLVTQTYHEVLIGMHHGEGNSREAILDEQTGQFYGLREYAHHGRFRDEDGNAKILCNGRVFWKENERESILTIFDPATRSRVHHQLAIPGSIVVGDRYLLGQSGVDGQKFEWADLLADHPNVETTRVANSVSADLTTPIDSIPGSDCFYKLSNSHLDMPGLAPNSPPSQPSPALGKELEWLVLFQMTDKGPKELSAWQVTGANGNRTIKTGKRWITSLSLDRKTVDCRSATTGELLHQFVVPAGAKQADQIPNWTLANDTLVFHQVTGVNPAETRDLLSGALVPTDGTNFHILSREGNHYTILEPYDFQLQQPWPPWFQIRELPTGNRISRFPLPAEDCYFDLCFLGPQLRISSGSTIFYYVDVQTGEIVRVLDPYLWSRRLGNIIVIAAVLWIVLWIRSCYLKNESPLFCYLVITSGCVTFLGLRIASSGGSRLFERLAWQILFSIGLAWGLACLMPAWRRLSSSIRMNRGTPQFSLRFFWLATLGTAVLIWICQQLNWLALTQRNFYVPFLIWLTLGWASAKLVTWQRWSLATRGFLIGLITTFAVGIHAGMVADWRFELWYPGCSLVCVAFVNAIAFYRPGRWGAGE